MRHGLLLSLSLLLCTGAAPSRIVNYQSGTEIEDSDVESNEDAVFDYLQAGVDTYAANSITTEAIATGAVTSNDILDGTIQTTDLGFAIAGGALLPSGAVYFMLTGSCPAGTTDISSTYSGYFLRTNSTQGTVAGADTHTHTAGSYTGAAHTHTGSASTLGGALTRLDDNSGGTDVDWNNPTAHTHTITVASGGAGAITGTSASGDNVPVHITAKLCQVN